MDHWSLVLLLPVGIAVFCDLWTREIPNGIPLLIVAWACLATVTGLHQVTWLGLAAGALLGLAVGAPVFYLGGLGGGDVKLLAAIGAAVGPLALLSIMEWMARLAAHWPYLQPVAENRISPTDQRSPLGYWWKLFGREVSSVSCSTKRSPESRRVRATHHRMPRVGAFHAPRNRRGQSLVEFALVALVVYMLLAAILSFGQILYSAQALQEAADVAAREISRTPLLATANVMDVLYSSNPSDYSSGTSTVRTSLFNPQLLEYDLTTLPAGQSILDQVKTWPAVNQMLYPVMIPIIPPGETQAHWLSYPGVVPCNDSSGTNRTVYCVARVDSSAASGAETITWVPVIEEIDSRRVFGGFATRRTGVIAD